MAQIMNAPPRRSIIPLVDFERSEHSHELVDAEHGDVPFSVILRTPGEHAITDWRGLGAGRLRASVWTGTKCDGSCSSRP